MLEGFKPLYNRFLRPAIRLFHKTGIKPNHLTVAGVAFFCAAAWFVFQGHWKMSVLFIVVGSFLDGWDGLLARETGQITRFGGILDSVCDRVTEIVWILGIMGYYLTHPAYPVAGAVLCFTAITGSLMVSYVKARCEGAGVPCSEGLMQRPERIILLGAFSLAGPTVMIWGLAALTALACITVIQRIITAAKNA